MGPGKSTTMKPSPYFVFQQAAGHQGIPPEPGRRTTIFGQKLRECDRRIKVDHRSLRSASSSSRSSLKKATGAAERGSPVAGSAGGVNQPLRIASARNASARIGLLVSLGGLISATTRSRSVTSIVSPPAASRTYSLSLLFNILMPTDLMHDKVATSSYFVNDLLIPSLVSRSVINPERHPAVHIQGRRRFKHPAAEEEPVKFNHPVIRNKPDMTSDRKKGLEIPPQVVIAHPDLVVRAEAAPGGRQRIP